MKRIPCRETDDNKVGLVSDNPQKELSTRVNVISWCVRIRRVQDPVAQVAAIGSHKPDLVALQGVHANLVLQYKVQLSRINLKHFLDSFSLFPRDWPVHRFSPGVLIASIYPLSVLIPDGISTTWLHRFLSTIVRTPWGNVIMHSVQVPKGGGGDEGRIPMLEAIYEWVTLTSSSPQILCGVLDLFREELSDGNVITWGRLRQPSGKVAFRRRDDARRLDQAQRSIIFGLTMAGIPDVYRRLHGHEKLEYSYYAKRRESRVGKRVDHVFASLSLRPVEATYLHEIREQELSDHSPMKVVFDYGRGKPRRSIPSIPMPRRM